MRSKISMIILCVAALFATESSFAQSTLPLRVDMPLVRYSELEANDSILNDVYVKLYLARLRRAKLVIEREKQELGVVIKRRDRAEVLYRKQAMSAEELEEKRKQVEVAAIRIQEAEAEAEEAETFVDIAVSRISIGLEMPICAEIR